MAEPMFRMHPYKTLLLESLMATASNRVGRALLRRSMESLTKDEFIQIMMATSLCLHYEPGYKIGKPLLMMVGDRDMTGNIRKAMPLWAKHEPDWSWWSSRRQNTPPTWINRKYSIVHCSISCNGGIKRWHKIVNHRSLITK